MYPDIQWNADKSAELKERHGFGFERVLVALADGGLLDERRHPNVEKYGHQRQLVVEIDGYAWIVPFVTDGERVFLKTLFPSRKATRDFLGG
ncbi:toxin [Aminobacter sp. Piv2-1]|uniref:toxin n=1 Tax=Aminobacter sp. Piv2-1 TaxID=3031122 RepID=UPI00309E17F3